MEYFELGDLQTHLGRPLPEWEAQHVAHQLLEGLEQLRLNGFAHRDVKPAVSAPRRCQHGGMFNRLEYICS